MRSTLSRLIHIHIRIHIDRHIQIHIHIHIHIRIHISIPIERNPEQLRLQPISDGDDTSFFFYPY